MKLLFGLCILVNTAYASLPYKWDKNIGNDRTERGLEDEKKLADIKEHNIFRLVRSCQEDEVLITGGCSSAFGFNITGSFPFTSRVEGSITEWICIGQPDFSTALTTKGNYPNQDTPKEKLMGDLMVIIVCEKRR